MVSTLSVLVPDSSALYAMLTPLGAVCLLVFCLLYTPCIAAVASIKRELGAKWAIAVVVEQCVIAWIAACLAHLVGMLLGF